MALDMMNLPLPMSFVAVGIVVSLSPASAVQAQPTSGVTPAAVPEEVAAAPAIAPEKSAEVVAATVSPAPADAAPERPAPQPSELPSASATESAAVAQEAEVPSVAAVTPAAKPSAPAPALAAPTSPAAKKRVASTRQAPTGTGPGLVATVGTTSGLGIGYRQFFGRFGVQLAGIGGGSSTDAFASGGLQFFYTFIQSGKLRFYGLLGTGTYFSLDEGRSNLGLLSGPGLGLQVTDHNNVFFGAEVPLNVFVRFEGGNYQSDDLLIIPGFNAFLGYEF